MQAIELRDTVVPGFLCKIIPAGRRVFMLQYRTAVALASNAAVLLTAMAGVGLLALVTQVLVAYAAILAPPGERGRVVGVVTSGIIVGILLARTVAGTLSDLFGWRSVYFVSAFATLAVTALLFKALQDLRLRARACPIHGGSARCLRSSCKNPYCAFARCWRC